MQTVQNISDIKYFLHQWDIIDDSYDYNVQYSNLNPVTNFTSMPTFVADFHNCSVASLPVLITEDRKMITNHVWPLISKYRDKPKKVHNFFTKWADTIEINMPPITKQFQDTTWKYVWLPIDEYSANNPWHIWIDIVSKFRLLEKRWATNFTKFIFILSNPSKYFDKVATEFFPELKYYVMPKNETWRFYHLVVPSLSNHTDGIISPNMPKWLRRLGNVVVPGQPKPTRKIFLTRKDAENRNISNQEQLVLALKGWEQVTLDNLTLTEQVKIFKEASHILSPHGAGLVNTLWCQPGTKVIELQHKKFIDKKVYPILSYHLGLHHKVYLAKAKKINKAKPKNKKSKDMVDLEINIPELIKLLD